MRSQTTCSVSLFSSVHILTVGLRGVGLSEVDCTYICNITNCIKYMMSAIIVGTVAMYGPLT